MLNDSCYAVVMAGGGGTRLWPLSTTKTPKHLLKLFDGKCLLELTIDKIRPLVPNDRVIVLTSERYRELTRETLPEIPADNCIYEPCVRDTASAIGLAATVLKKRCPQATMIMLTADQVIDPADRFNEAIAHAADFLEQNPERLIAFGVEAASANTKVGWQKLGEVVDFPGCEVRAIAAFTEKPDQATAQRYMDDGGYRWNSGQFAWKAGAILNAIETHVPEAGPILQQIGEKRDTASRTQVLEELFPRLPKISIDYAVMQKTDHACSVLVPCSWDDMGTHISVADTIGKKEGGNKVLGNAVVMGAGNRVMNMTGRTVVVGCDNAVVVVTDEAVFVGDPQTDLKALVAKVGQRAPELL